MPNIGGWAGIAAKLAGAKGAGGTPAGMGGPGGPGGGYEMLAGWGGFAPKPDVTPTSPYYPTGAPTWIPFTPEDPSLGGYYSSEDLGYGYKPSDSPGFLDVFMLSDPNTMVGTISEAELWSGRGTQTTPWGQEQAAPRPPEPILSMEDPYGKLQEWLGLLPQQDTVELKTTPQPGRIAPEISGVTPDGLKVYYVPTEGGVAEVWNRTTGEMLGTVPTATIAAQLGETYGALGAGVAERFGFGGGYGAGIPSEPRERREEDLLALPGAGWEGIGAKIEGITPEMATMMLMDPRWGAEERAAALPIKEAYKGWQENVLSGELSPIEAIESFTGLFDLPEEPSVAEQTRLMQDIVQFGILTDAGIERARQLYEKEYRAQLDKDATEDEARDAAQTKYDEYTGAMSFMEDFVPTGFSWDALHEVMAQSPELQATLLSLFQEKGDLPHGVVRKFYSMEDYYRWQTSVAEGQPTTEADVIWSPYKKITEFVPAGAKYMAEPGGKELIAETSETREIYVPQDTKYQERAEQILGYTPVEGQLITPSDARAIVKGAMWGGGATGQKARLAVELREAGAKGEITPSVFRKIYTTFLEKQGLSRELQTGLEAWYNTLYGDFVGTGGRTAADFSRYLKENEEVIMGLHRPQELWREGR